MLVRGKRVLKNGISAGYVYNKKTKKWKWSFLKGGYNSNYIDVDNLNNIILFFYKNSGYDYELKGDVIQLDSNSNYRNMIGDFTTYSRIFFESLLQSGNANTIFNSGSIKGKYDKYIKETAQFGNIFKKKRNMFHDILISFYLYTTNLYNEINPLVRKKFNFGHFKMNKSNLSNIIDKVHDVSKSFSGKNKEKFMKRTYQPNFDEMKNISVLRDMKNGNRKNSLMESFKQHKYSIFDTIYFMYLGYYLIINTFDQLIPSKDIFLYRSSGQEVYKNFKRNLNINQSQISNSSVLSTTVRPHSLFQFLAGNNKVIEIIKVVKGVMPIVLVDSISSFEVEKEVILPFSIKRDIVAVNNYENNNYDLKIDDALFPKKGNIKATKIYFSLLNPY